MSLLSKLCLSLSGISLIIITTTRWILGGWLPVLWVFMALLVICLICALIIDYKFYIGFLLMRTTKNGMSMGASILITLVLCISIAYLGVHFEKSIDITEEQINSLSPQTLQLLESLEDKVNVTIFYKGRSGDEKKELIKKNLFFMKKNSKKIKARYYDAHSKNKLAQEYLNEVPNKEQQDIFMFVEYKGKKVLVDFPFNEEKLTSAMIKATRRKENTIYFITGHGEKDLFDQSGGGLSSLKESLENSSFQVKTWSFVTDGSLPKDASSIVIVGPDRPYLEKELQWLETYLKKGGRAFIALDPDKKHNLKKLVKSFGINYTSYYIMDQVAAFVGLGPFSPMGVFFDPQHAISKSFQKGTFAVFHLASNLKIEDSPDGFSATEIVKTNVNTLAVPDINTKEAKDGEKTAHAIAILVEEQKNSPEKEATTEKKEEAIAEDKDKIKNSNESQTMLAVFGDSDFLSNDFINSRGINRDLAMNTLSYLVDENDLVSIRPKRLKATQLTLKSSDQMIMVLFAIALPIILFISSFIIWIRRRSA